MKTPTSVCKSFVGGYNTSYGCFFVAKYNGTYVISLSCGSSSSTGQRPFEDFDSIPNEMLFSSDIAGITAWYKGELRSILSLLDEGVFGESDIDEIRRILKEEWWKQ